MSQYITYSPIYTINRIIRPIPPFMIIKSNLFTRQYQSTVTKVVEHVDEPVAEPVAEPVVEPFQPLV